MSAPAGLMPCPLPWCGAPARMVGDYHVCCTAGDCPLQDADVPIEEWNRRTSIRLLLQHGIVGDHDGAYDWVDPSKFDDPDYAVGRHDGGWGGESYAVVEVMPLPPQPEV